MLDLVKKYLTQKTTWAGLFSILGAIGIALEPALQEAVIGAAIAVTGVALVLLDESKGE